MQATTSKSCRSASTPSMLRSTMSETSLDRSHGVATSLVSVSGAPQHTRICSRSWSILAGKIVPGTKIVFNTRADDLFACVVRRDRSQTSVQVLRTPVQCDSVSILSLTSCSNPGFSIVLSVTVQTVGRTSMSDPMHNPQFIPSCVMPDALRALIRQAIALRCCQYRDLWD